MAFTLHREPHPALQAEHEPEESDDNRTDGVSDVEEDAGNEMRRARRAVWFSVALGLAVWAVLGFVFVLFIMIVSNLQ